MHGGLGYTARRDLPIERPAGDSKGDAGLTLDTTRAPVEMRILHLDGSLSTIALDRLGKPERDAASSER
jgi:hypothetical protein